jgi:mannan endo-1,4-beta-mannosidase
MKSISTALVLLSLATGSFGAQDVLSQFVHRDGDKLMDENGRIRFLSFNIPCLHYNEDNMAFTRMNPWGLTDEFEISDALEAVRQMGGQVVRIYALSVRSAGDDPNTPRHIIGPGQCDDKTFQSLDMVLAVANRKGVRVIIPFIDNWKWWGGIGAMAAFRGKTDRQFWTDPELFEDYQKVVSYALNRKNSITGTPYREDKAVFAWETGNEIGCPPEWTAKAAAYIKSLDKNHLVIDGATKPTVREESLADDNIDLVTTHHYSKNIAQTVNLIKNNAARARGKKPYFVGEFGFIPTDAVATIVQAVMDEKIAGALLWSLRFHARDGGFYWHSEPAGGDLFKAYHWPGFASNAAFDETACLTLMRNKAYEIREMPVPPIRNPAPPVLLTTDDVSALSWQGSAGARSYVVERSSGKDGPWQTAGRDISDAALQYRPLFNDAGAAVGQSYYYRVTAQNAAGASGPSNVIGPIAVPCRTLIDEMQDWRFILRRDGDLTLHAEQARKCKEDAHRVRGGAGASMIYQVDAPISSWKVFSFFPGDVKDFKFSVSPDGRDFKPVEFKRQDYYAGSGQYDYFKPVLYSGTGPGAAKCLKIEFRTEAQISRVEIRYGGKDDV